jgi:hypothetical protein
MKAGDLVRFRLQPGFDWKVGLLIEYYKWEKIATVLFNDNVVRIAARDVQKYGRRYLNEKRRSS